MTLGRQLIITILIILIGLFCGMLLFTVKNTQLFLNSQLAAHSKDTATVLGLSLSHAMKDNDIIVAERMVDSIWDAGYYKNIKVESLDGAPLVKKEMQVRVKDVPDWFIQAFDLRTTRQDAFIQSGWMQIGKVYVESNPGFAYKQIWKTFTDSLVWFLIMAGVSLALTLTLLHFILKPLRDITKQARAICEKDFQIQDKLPWTIDLKQVVQAMNTMSSRLQMIFEEQARDSEHLRQQAFQSPVTQLGNRRYFDIQLENIIRDSQGTSGVLLLIALHEFKSFNDEHGYEKGDELLRTTADAIVAQSKTHENAICTHLGGADFAVMVPNHSLLDGQSLGEDIIQAFDKFMEEGVTPNKDVGHIGVTVFSPRLETKEVLAQADMALRKAQSMGPNQVCLQEEQNQEDIHGAREWGKILDEVIAKEDIVLYFQPYKIFGTLKDKFHYEALLRLKDEEGGIIPAFEFMPMAQRLNKMPELDILVAKNIVQRILDEKGTHTYSINLSAKSLDESSFVSNLVGELKKLGSHASKLYIEVAEYGVVSRLDACKSLFAKLRKIGVHTGVDHYGKNFTTFGYLHSLNVSMLKIDGSFIRGIKSDPENQFFIRSLISIAHSLDIMIIAEAVETETEMVALKQLKVDGIQGYFLGRPEPTIESR